MGKRLADQNQEFVKRRRNGLVEVPLEVKFNSILTDLTGKKWRLGKCIGTGAFGEIYLASDQIDKEVTVNSPYVIKVESFSSGPLFVEINCYLRIGKKEMIEEWEEQHNIQQLGMPYYVASGSHTVRNGKYRFLVLPRYKMNLEELLIHHCKFNIKTVIVLSIQIINVLRYIHSKGYIHSDIKASNILLENKVLKKKPTALSSSSKVSNRSYTLHRSCKASKKPPGFNLHSNNDNVAEETNNQAYLLDYGLASKYLHSDGSHRESCVDQRRAHVGTILFCSRDAHEGMSSRRSDLECLGYNMTYWLTNRLPWMDDTEDPNIVANKKKFYMENLVEFLNFCFVDSYPRFLFKYLKYITNLAFDEEPDYNFCTSLFQEAIKQYCYKENMCFDFDNQEGWGFRQKILKNENRNNVKGQVVYKFVRTPLRSNLPILRKRMRETNKKPRMISWSEILCDPETIMKQGRERNATDSSISYFDIDELNPTPAMLEVYNRLIERSNNCNGTYKGDTYYNNIEGYTPAMVAVFNRKKEREEYEAKQILMINAKNSKSSSRQKKNNIKKKTKKSLSNGTTVGKKNNTKRSKTVVRRNYSLRG